MRHELAIEGPFFRLRPVGDGDAPFIVELRNDPTLGHFLHPGAADVSAQIDWLAEYYERAGDCYFVIERKDDNRAEGLIALYDIDLVSMSAYMGRWVVRSKSLAAVESAWLIYRVGFEMLTLESIYMRTIMENQAVVSFHDSCNITDRQPLPEYFRLRHGTYDAIEHRLHRTDWATISSQLEACVNRLAHRLSRYHNTSGEAVQ